MDAKKTDGEKAWRQLHKNWTSPEGNTPQSSSYKATYHPSLKLSMLDETDIGDTAGEVGNSSYVMYPYRPLHMVEQGQGDQLAPTYSSSVRIRGVALNTCGKRWTIGRGDERERERERELGISVLMSRQDDDDDGINQFPAQFLTECGPPFLKIFIYKTKILVMSLCSN